MKDVILKGDCYELIKSISTSSIDLVYIDIPYLVKNMELGNGCIISINIEVKYENFR